MQLRNPSNAAAVADARQDAQQAKDWSEDALAAASLAEQQAAAAQAAATDPASAPLGTPDGGWPTGYAPIEATTRIINAVRDLNVGLHVVDGIAQTALQTAEDAEGFANDALSAANTADATATDALTRAQAPGQQPAGLPTGGSWSPGAGTYTAASLITDILNDINARLLAGDNGLSGQIAALDDQLSGQITAATGRISVLETGATGQATAISELGGQISAIDDELGTVNTIAQNPGQQPARTPSGGWVTGYSTFNSSTLITDAVNTLNAGLGTVNTLATNAGISASGAATAAASPGDKAAGTPSGGWGTGYATLTSATAINGALNLLNTGLAAVNTSATSAASLASSPGAQAVGTPTGGWSTGYAAITNAVAINKAIDLINAGLQTVASSISAGPVTIGTPTDGSFGDGLSALTTTTTLADAVDTLNESALSLTQGGYNFTTLVLNATGLVRWNTRSRLGSSSDGTLQLTNAAGVAGNYEGAKYITSLTDSAVHYGSATAGLAIGADTVALTTAGTQRLRINATGLMGINTDPVTGNLLTMTYASGTSTEYAINITSADAGRWFRVRNDGRVIIQPYCQVNNVVLGIYGNSSMGSTAGAVLDFSNNVTTSSYSFVSAASMSVNPTFLFNAKSTANTLDLMRWQQNGVTVATMANGGALTAPGHYAATTQAAAGTTVWGDADLLNGMGVNTTTNAVIFRTNNIDALTLDASQNHTIPAGSHSIWSGRTRIASPADQQLQLLPNSNTGNGTSLVLGWIFGQKDTTGASLVRGGNGILRAMNGDQTANGVLQASSFVVTNASGATNFGDINGALGMALNASNQSLTLATNSVVAMTINSAQQVLFKVGTSALPSVAVGALDGGLYSPSTSDVGVVAGGIPVALFLKTTPGSAVAKGTLQLGVTGTGTGATSQGVRLVSNFFDAQAILGLRSADDTAWGSLYCGSIFAASHSTATNTVNNSIGFYDGSSGTMTTTFTLKSASTLWLGTNNRAGTATVSAGIQMLKPVAAKTAAYTVLTSDSNTTFSNVGATASVTFTLPLASTGLKYGFVVRAAQTIVIAPNALDTIVGQETAFAAGGSVSLPAVAGHFVVLECLSANVWSIVATSDGATASGNLTIAATSKLAWTGRGGIGTTADGLVQILDSAAATGSLLLGPATTNGLKVTIASQVASLLTGNNSNAIELAVFKTNINNNYSVASYTRPSSTGTGASTYHVRSTHSASVTLTGLSSATTVTTNFDNGFYLLAVIVRQSTTITGATGFNIGDTGTAAPLLTPGASLSATAFGSNVPTTYASSTGFAHHTVQMPRWYGAGTLTITLTPVGAATFTTGVVTVTCIIERVPSL
jgi:hypothetical protein